MFCYQNSFSQNRYKTLKPTTIYVGTNIIDDSFTSENSLINISERMHIVSYPSLFGVGVKLNDYFQVDATLTFNHYKKGKLVDGKYLKKSHNYVATDVFVKLDLNDINYKLNFLPFVKPYITLGGGFSNINNVNRFTVNYGFGAHIWFKDFDNCCFHKIINNLGAIIQLHAKSSLDQKVYGNQIQLMMGLAYRI
jgi:hypothetical protein